MSDDEIVSAMIDFVDAKEKEIQKSRLGNDTQVKNTVIKFIISKLEEYTNDEN